MLKITKPKNLVIWGASGHALFVNNIISLLPQYIMAGFIDDFDSKRAGSYLSNLPVLGGSEVLGHLDKYNVDGIVIGFGNCSARVKVVNDIRCSGCSLITIIHPNASVSSTAELSEGVVVGPGAIVDANCTIGSNCVINNNGCVSHGSTIGENVNICPGVTIGGDVCIGSGSWIGIGATIIEKVKIGANSYIGAGSLVLSDVPDSTLAYGVPAKIIKRIKHTF